MTYQEKPFMELRQRLPKMKIMDHEIKNYFEMTNNEFIEWMKTWERCSPERIKQLAKLGYKFPLSISLIRMSIMYPKLFRIAVHFLGNDVDVISHFMNNVRMMRKGYGRGLKLGLTIWTTKFVKEKECIDHGMVIGRLIRLIRLKPERPEYTYAVLLSKRQLDEDNEEYQKVLEHCPLIRAFETAKNHVINGQFDEALKIVNETDGIDFRHLLRFTSRKDIASAIAKKMDEDTFMKYFDKFQRVGIITEELILEKISKIENKLYLKYVKGYDLWGNDGVLIHRDSMTWANPIYDVSSIETIKDPKCVIILSRSKGYIERKLSRNEYNCPVFVVTNLRQLPFEEENVETRKILREQLTPEEFKYIADCSNL